MIGSASLVSDVNTSSPFSPSGSTLPDSGGARMRGEEGDLRGSLARIDALLFDLFGNRQHVRRRHHDDARLEVPDQLDLPFGLSAGHGDHGAAELFRTIVRAQAPGKQ